MKIDTAETFINIQENHPTIRFAAKELSRYLNLAGIKTKILLERSKAQKNKNQISLCIDRPSETDHILIKPDKNGYIISGSNPRSVLFASYRFLYEMGFRWIRPGKRGEIIPSIKRIKKDISIDEIPSYKYRTLCIEGAVSCQHVIDIIDWAAKNYMNGYFIQFHLGTSFFKRWYQHSDNPYMKPEKLGKEDVEKIVARIIKEIEKRGIRFERMGHGWTCRALGIEGEGWDTENEGLKKISQEKQKYLAMLNGKREFFRNVPLNTNLCYSNPEVRSAITDAIVDYAEKHPEVDALHFWLADGSNNNCECENCIKTRVSDFYVMMLNELDKKLTLRNIPTKIIFLIYVDLLWPPEREKIENQDRFIIMFAPITRSYSHSFSDTKPEEGIKPYVKNKLVFPKNAADNMLYLQRWQENFKGDGVDFDYHIIWACYYDLNHFTLAKVLHKDIGYLKKMNLHGFISCQVQRASFPTNLLMDILSRTLWNRKISFNAVVEETFDNAFGKKYSRDVAEFLRKMSDLWKPFFEPVFIPKTDEKRINLGLDNIKKMQDICKSFRPLVKKQAACEKNAVGWSWKYLDYYLELLDLLIPAYSAYLRRSSDCREKFERAFDFVKKNEKILHPALDVSTFTGVLRWRINEAEGIV